MHVLGFQNKIICMYGTNQPKEYSHARGRVHARLQLFSK